MIDPKEVSIIIPHLGANKESEYALNQTWESLNATTSSKIIIASNGGHECHIVSKIDLLLSEQGQNKAVNAAVATTNTPWIFITNDDMIYPPGWWERLGRVNEFLSPMTVASPKLVEPRPGSPTFEVEFCGGASGDFDKQKFLDYAKRKFEEWQSVEGRELTKSGFNLPFLINRELWDTIGGYDINYDPWGSNGDSDLEYKIKLAGAQMVQLQDTRVYHFSQTSGTFEPRNDSYRFANYAYFKEKWGFDRTDDGIWEATFTIPSKEEGRIYLPEWEGKYSGN